jgi:protein-tyrosine phosphatase
MALRARFAIERAERRLPRALKIAIMVEASLDERARSCGFTKNQYIGRNGRNVREAIAKSLWLGTATDARDIAAVLNHKIVAVVDLAMEEPAIHYPRDVIYCRIPLVDGSGNRPQIVRVAVDLVASLIAMRVPTLVACGAGMSRSPIIVAAALTKIDGRLLEEALEEVTAGVPHDVSTSLWAEIKGVCGDWLD